MSKITLNGSDAVVLAKKLSGLPPLEFTPGKELVDAFINRCDTISRFNNIYFNRRIGFEVQSIDVDEETMLWICTIMEKDL